MRGEFGRELMGGRSWVGVWSMVNGLFGFIRGLALQMECGERLTWGGALPQELDHGSALCGASLAKDLGCKHRAFKSAAQIFGLCSVLSLVRAGDRLPEGNFQNARLKSCRCGQVE